MTTKHTLTVPPLPVYLTLDARQAIVRACQALEARGLTVSPSTIRRVYHLLPTSRKNPHTPHTRRFFTEQDIRHLEWILILKGLGMTNKEVARWLKAPDPQVVLDRATLVEQFAARARTFVHTLSGETLTLRTPGNGDGRPPAATA